MPKPSYYIIVLCLLFFNYNSHAQQPAYTYYTVREGLASNDTYNCVQDKKGFLWIATENGVARFDGIEFKNYTVANGLPDNDVLVVEMDTSGTIWALPFQRTPAYYDDKTDKFINTKTDKALAQITLGNVVNTNILTDGAVAFCCSNGVFNIIKNKQCNTYKLNNNVGVARVICLGENKYVALCSDSSRIINGKNITTKAATSFYAKRTAFVNNQLYVADSNTLYKVAIYNDGSMGTIVKNVLPFKIVNLNFTQKQLAISSGSGNIYFADTATLQFSSVGLSFNALTRYVYEDNAGNTWICTRESGLIRYQQKGILTISEKEYNKNFNTLTFWNNKLVAGTNNGQFLIYNGLYDIKTISLNNESNFNTWIRRLKVYNNKLFIIAEGGLFNYQNNLAQNTIFTKQGNSANKDFLFLNDTIAIAGNSSDVRKINYNNLYAIDLVRIRATCLEAIDDKTVYIGSNTGLYKWQNCNNLIYLNRSDNILTNRVNNLAYNKTDKILWVALAYDTLVAMQNDNVVAKIPLNTKLPGNESRAIYSNQKGIAWVGTNAALAKITYTLIDKNLQYKITTFTTADGIAGKQINDIAVHNDTVYVATNAGISLLPQQLQFNVPNAAVYISSIKINNTDTVLQNEYTLPYTASNISINFTSPDLGSTNERMYEYKINNGDWIKTSETKIELLQLAPNTYNIKIRAINRDGEPSTNIAMVSFIINAPFWQRPLFILLALFLIIGLLIYFLQRKNKIKREKSIQQLLTEKKLTDLELKALKAQINPHFVFNCLNSIKYLNHQKKYSETDIYLDKFSYLLRKTLDFSGLQKITLQEELLYSQNYLELEKLRLGNTLQFFIDTDKNIDATKTLVPPMLLQPYLENAIKHGIRFLPINKTGIININTKKLNENIICSITDNGVGIAVASAKNKTEKPEHISQGNMLQQRRADLYNVEVHISTPTNSIGTLVTLTLQNETIP